MNRKKPRCHCGVYEWAHLAGRGCGNYRKASRLRLWHRDHLLRRHVAGWVWLHVPSKWRWRIVGWFNRDGVCWCDLVDAAHGPDAKREDYKRPYGCLCDVPLPTDAGAPRPGWCYCDPAEFDTSDGAS